LNRYIWQISGRHLIGNDRGACQTSDRTSGRHLVDVKQQAGIPSRYLPDISKDVWQTYLADISKGMIGGPDRKN
jgi:hypothetical protein